MWKPEHRAEADQRGLRYESDLTDAEWALVGSASGEARRSAADGERPRGPERHLLRALDRLSVEGASEGPAAAQPGLGSTLTCGTGTARSGRIHQALYVEVREQAGREASPTTAIIDSQTANVGRIHDTSFRNAGMSTPAT